MSSMTVQPGPTQVAGIDDNDPERPRVVAGIDTHSEVHHVVVVTAAGVGEGAEFATTMTGLDELMDWLGVCQVTEVGIEGTSSYGLALTVRAQAADLVVAEASSVDRAQRRGRGKSDRGDAETIAWQMWHHQATVIPKHHGGLVDQVRMLVNARDLMVEHSVQVINQTRALLVTAPEPVRDRLRGLKDPARFMRACTTLTVQDFPHPHDPLTQATLDMLTRWGQWWHDIRTQITDLTARITALVTRICPELLDLRGVGPVIAARLILTAGENPHRFTSEAAFANLTGVAPIPASSGNTRHLRLSRGGDRQANKALHTLMLVRLRTDQTRAYIAQATARGKTRRMIHRSLKRYLARTIYKTMINSPTYTALTT